MDDRVILDIGREAFMTIITMSGPIMLAGLVIGLTISIFQTITSIQEQTLTFVPKIIMIFSALLILLPFMIHKIITLGHSMFDKMINLGLS